MVVLCVCTVQIPSWVRTLTYEASIHINAILNAYIFPYICLWRSDIYSLFSNIYLKILCTNSVFKISMNKRERILWIYGLKKIPHENDEWNSKFCAEKTHSPEYTHIVIAWVECSACCVSKKKCFQSCTRLSRIASQRKLQSAEGWKCLTALIPTLSFFSLLQGHTISQFVLIDQLAYQRV